MNSNYTNQMTYDKKSQQFRTEKNLT